MLLSFEEASMAPSYWKHSFPHMAKNKKYFGQAHSTTFTKAIIGKISFSRIGPVAESILEGTIQVADPIVQLVLDNLKQPETVAKIPAIVTLKEIKGKCNNWKETTSTSLITKWHSGHYQCLTQLIDQEEEKEDNAEPDTAVLQAKKMLNAHFLLLPLSH
jgi:hypothetical protein